jgi:hypothetical protein
MMRRAALALLWITISYFMYTYTYQGIAASLPPFALTYVQWAYWLFFPIVMVMALSGLFISRHSRLFRIGIHVYIIVLVSQLVFAAVLLSEDVFRIGYSWLASISHASPLSPVRSPLVSQIGLAFAAVPLVSFIYGMVKGKYKYTVHRHTLYFDNLPKAFDGYTLTQISDIHAGSFDDAEAVQRGIDLINAQNSDLFVFTGDLVNYEAAEFDPWVDLFSRISARDGKYSVLGNHDYGDYRAWHSALAKQENLERLKEHHRAVGWQLLLDEHITLQRGDDTLKLLGVENWGVGFGKRGNLSKALEGTNDDDFKILLSHDPTHWQEQVRHETNSIHLTLSGHTHGMQFGIEKFGIKWSPVKLRYPHWAGMADHNGRYLYINRGFGFLGFSGRVGIWPEITVIELRRSTHSPHPHPLSASERGAP